MLFFLQNSSETTVRLNKSPSRINSKSIIYAKTKNFLQTICSLIRNGERTHLEFNKNSYLRRKRIVTQNVLNAPGRQHFRKLATNPLKS